MDSMQTEGFRSAPHLPVKPRLAPAPRAHALDKLDEATRTTLKLWAAAEDNRRRTRAQIVLLAAEGFPPEGIGQKLSLATPTVYKWLRRFGRGGLAALSDLPRSGQPHRLPRETRAEILRVTREELPPNGTRWTIRVAARHLGVTQHQIRQVWSDAGYKPHDILPNTAQIEA